MLRKVLLLLVAATAISLLGLQNLSAEVIYREVFPNNTGADAALSGDGWQINTDDGSLAATQINSSTDGTPINVSAVNSNPDSAEIAKGYAFNNDTDSVDYLFWTSEYTVDRDVWDVESISWYQANQSSSVLSRAAIKVGTLWYASDETFSDTSSNVAANGQLQTLDFATAAWRTLNFTDGSELSLGSSTTLTSGDITAFGWYVDSKSGRLRLDSYAITAVPEPGTAVLLISAMLCVVVLRRRMLCI